MHSLFLISLVFIAVCDLSFDYTRVIIYHKAMAWFAPPSIADLLDDEIKIFNLDADLARTIGQYVQTERIKPKEHWNVLRRPQLWHTTATYEREVKLNGAYMLSIVKVEQIHRNKNDYFEFTSLAKALCPDTGIDSFLPQTFSQSIDIAGRCDLQANYSSCNIPTKNIPHVTFQMKRILKLPRNFFPPVVYRPLSRVVPSAPPTDTSSPPALPPKRKRLYPTMRF